MPTAIVNSMLGRSYANPHRLRETEMTAPGPTRPPETFDTISLSGRDLSGPHETLASARPATGSPPQVASKSFWSPKKLLALAFGAGLLLASIALGIPLAVVTRQRDNAAKTPKPNLRTDPALSGFTLAPAPAKNAPMDAPTRHGALPGLTLAPAPARNAPTGRGALPGLTPGPARNTPMDTPMTLGALPGSAPAAAPPRARHTDINAPISHGALPGLTPAPQGGR